MPLPTALRQISPVVSALLAALLAAALGAAAAPAQASDTAVKGSAALTLGAGKAGKMLKRQRVKVVRVAPGTAVRLKTGRFRVKLPAGSLDPTPARVGLAGGFIVRRGARRLAARQLAVAAGKQGTWITGRVGAARIRLFRVGAKLKVERAWQNLEWHLNASLAAARLDLSPALARQLRKRLKLKKRLPLRGYGRLGLTATRLEQTEKPPDIDLGDPYFAQCGIKATAIGTGDFPPAPPLPEIADAVPLTADGSFDWGLKQGLRNYLKMFGGSMHALDGAGLIGTDPSGKLTNVQFSYPLTGGSYSETTGQAVINGSGTGVFCNKVHGFRVALSNPTLVIDGADSRLDADVDFNKFGTWVKTQRTTILTLDATGVPAVENGDELTWTDLPAKFTDAGAWPFCAEGGPPGTPNVCIYKGPSGENGATETDPVTVTVKTDPE